MKDPTNLRMRKDFTLVQVLQLNALASSLVSFDFFLPLPPAYDVLSAYLVLTEISNNSGLEEFYCSNMITDWDESSTEFQASKLGSGHSTVQTVNCQLFTITLTQKLKKRNVILLLSYRNQFLMEMRIYQLLFSLSMIPMVLQGQFHLLIAKI